MGVRRQRGVFHGVPSKRGLRARYGRQGQMKWGATKALDALWILRLPHASPSNCWQPTKAPGRGASCIHKARFESFWCPVVNVVETCRPRVWPMGARLFGSSGNAWRSRLRLHFDSGMPTDFYFFGGQKIHAIFLGGRLCE